MNHLPVTAAQKIALRGRTMLLARLMERYLLALNTLDDVRFAFNLLIDVEPDLDVARMYAHDRDAFAHLPDDRRRTLIEDYRTLAFSPPDKADPGAPKVEPRLRYSTLRVWLNSDPGDARMIDLYEPLTPEDKIVTEIVKKRREEFRDPPREGGTADWFDSAKQPEEWTPKATQDDLDKIRRIVLPSHCEPTPSPTTPGPIGPPHLESDWSGARVSVIGGDFNGARGKVT